ncbi:MAG: hypothetical protein E3J26_01445 [Candidatus Zixiibacteriota bacterium]|nr:MAG: hypothetical protein E3J26_01445 [candidate division Zixibacteria bacterium]
MKEPVTTTVWRLIAVPLLCMLLAASALAQESEEPRNNRNNSLIKGAWAFQFEIVGDLFNLDLRNLYGTSLALKKHTSSGSALRIGLGLGLNLSNDDRTSEQDGDTIIQSDYDRNSQSVNIVMQKIFYPAPNADVNFFYGLGPQASFGHNKSTREYPSPTRWTSFESYSWSLGITGVLGVEWFPTRSISLLAEYGSDIQYKWQKSKDKSLRTYPDDTTALYVSENKSKSFSLGTSSVKVGLSVYF